MLPLISVIVPVYNREKTIKKCINSIISQTYSNIEIIIVDDGSTDNSLKKCKELSVSNENIIVYHQNNKGVSAARNYGLKESKGEYVMFVDSDDWLEQNAVEYLFKKLTPETDIVCSCCNVNIDDMVVVDHFFDGNRIFENTYKSKRDLYFQLLDTSYGQPQEKIYTGIGVPWAKIYRRKFINQVGIQFDERINHLEDNLFNLILFYYSNVVRYVDIPLYNYSSDHITTVLNKYDKKLVTSYLLTTNERYHFLSKHNDLQNKDFEDKLLLETLNLLEIVVFNMIFDKNRKADKKTIITELKEVIEKYRMISILKKVNYKDIKNKKVRLIFRLLHLKRYNLVYYIYKIRSA
ncbi:MAG: glycosyltransferase family 2 protein [Ruminococcus sp.]|nr:glycosyltransferase family 2 protein [Ruminococcus sp.]